MPKRTRAEAVETYDSDGGFVSDDDGAVRKVRPLASNMNLSLTLPAVQEIQNDRR